MKNLFIALLTCFTMLAHADNPVTADIAKPYVTFETNKGSFILELLPEKAPITVANFLKYVEAGYYKNTIFHRVIKDFMIQGGGFTDALIKKATDEEIKNEADNGVFNNRGSVAMARTAKVDSATSQFFINLKNNYFLNNGHRDFGYCVFANVVSGMEVIEDMGMQATTTRNGMSDVPVENIIILNATISYTKP